MSFVPTPHESTFAPCDFKLVIVCSSKSFEAIILASGNRLHRAYDVLLSINMLSPESKRMPTKLILSPNSLATLIAVGTPDFNVWNVSTKNTQSL